MKAQTKTKEEAREIIARIEDQIHKVIIGQDDLIRRILIALFGRIPYSFKKRRGGENGLGAHSVGRRAWAGQNAARLGHREHY